MRTTPCGRCAPPRACSGRCRRGRICCAARSARPRGCASASTAARSGGAGAVRRGERGCGKPRLVEEFTRGLPEDVLFLQTACPPYGGESLGPLADLFRQLVGLAGLTTVAEVEARIPLGERAARAAMVVSRLFNLAEVPPGDEVTHETALLVAAETVRRLITRPTVVWIEDLQWADAGTRELLPFMMERLTDAPLLLVGNLRAGEEPLAWGKRTAVTTMQLEPLGEEDARALLAAMLEERLPADVERALIDKAGGNPFSLGEIVATLRSMGVLIRDDRGRWRTTGPVDQVLPDTVQGALLARLDRLPPPPPAPRPTAAARRRVIFAVVTRCGQSRHRRAARAPSTGGGRLAPPPGPLRPRSRVRLHPSVAARGGLRQPPPQAPGGAPPAGGRGAGAAGAAAAPCTAP